MIFWSESLSLSDPIQQSSKESRDEELAAAAAAVQINIKQVVLIELSFYPSSTVRNDSKSMQYFSTCMDRFLETYSGRTVKLANHNPLSTVDYEGASFSDGRKFSHENFFFAVERSTLSFHFETQPQLDMERGGKGTILVDAIISKAWILWITDILKARFFIVTEDWKLP